MPKKKISSKQELVGGDSYSPSLYVDFADLKEIKGLTVGEEVTVVIKGKVSAITQRDKTEYDPMRASVTLKDFTAEIDNEKNVFAELAEDD